MSENPLYGKRKKKIPSCANPLFIQWLKEWRDEAADKGMKTQFVYGKAIKSLQRYPLLLTSGKDCKILEHFGDKICKMLDDKLAEHVAEHGFIMPAVVHSDKGDKQRSRAQTKDSRPRVKDKSAAGIRQRPESADRQVGAFVTDEDMAAPPAPKRARSRSSSGDREYIPAYRSGPYAILLTLYRNMQIPNSRGFMTKAELIREAQPLADKSFSIPDAGSRYTSWSSMGTLIKKGFILKESSPAKYYITDAGCQLAHRLETVTDDGTAAVAPTCHRSTAAASNTLADTAHYNVHRNTSDQVPQEKGSDLEISYVSDSGEKVKKKDSAQVLIDDDIGIGFLVHCNYRQLLSSGKVYKLDTTRPLGDKVYAYLQNDDAPEDVDYMVTPRLPSLHLSSQHTGPENPVPVQPQRPEKPAKQKSVSTAAAPAILSVMDTVPSPQNTNVDHKISRNIPTDSQDSQSSIQSISSVSSTGSLPVPDFVLTAGSFEVVLCIDNQEFYGGGKAGSKNMLPDLIKNGVNCDLRKLQVGDILWIAREKTAMVPGQLGQPKARELVLNYVIERKRMDDLVHSCIDGRLPDQKFRLKHCGLRHAVFLIESHGSMQHFSMPEERLKQTITNLQVIDGFQVKRTRDNKETVAYLTVMTRFIQSSIMHKTLYASTREDLDNLVTNNMEEHLMTFEAFNKGSVKSKSLNVREMFSKQLIQVYGMSAEKAKAVTDLYPTLQSLLQAYDRCSCEKDKEAMLSTVKSGKSMRNLGNAQSKLIYQLYNSVGPLK